MIGGCKTQKFVLSYHVVVCFSFVCTLSDNTIYQKKEPHAGSSGNPNIRYLVVKSVLLQMIIGSININIMIKDGKYLGEI